MTLCRLAPRNRRRGAGTITFVGSAAGDAGPPTGSSGPGSTTMPAAWPPRCRRAAWDPACTSGVLGPTTRALVTTIQAICLAGGDRRRAAAADAPRVHRGVRRADPARASPTPTPGSWSSTATSRRSSTAARRHRGRRPARRARRGRRARGAAAWRVARADDPERLAILQFTSGSTADPKGVMLPTAASARTSTPSSRARRSTRRRPGGLVAAAVPRHGPHRAADDADAPRLRARARRPAGLPRRARVLAGVDLGVPRHHHRGTELLVHARGAARCGAPARSTCRAGGWR